MIGFVSQLTHCIAVSLMTCSDNTHLADYTGDSFRDLTRIARINDRMWSELFMMNRGPLLRQMDLFLHELQGFRDMLEKATRRECALRCGFPPNAGQCSTSGRKSWYTDKKPV